MADVRLALGSIADDVVVEGLPLPQLPGVRTGFDLRAGSPTPTGCVSLSSRTDWLARWYALNGGDARTKSCDHRALDP